MNELRGKRVKITAERFYELLKAEDELNALENWGVDNWCCYGEHREDMMDKEDLLEVVNEFIIVE